MKLFFAAVVLLLFALNVSAQTYVLRGKITDESGKPVSFASIYIRNTTTGTSANMDGEYILKVPAGAQDIVFKAIGYRQEVKQINVKSDIILDAELFAEALKLNDVVVSSGGKDPAYEIIKNAIKKRKEHLTEVTSYTADVYMKGLQKLLKSPKKFMGKDIEKVGREIGLDSNRQGILYLSESESKLSYMRPDNFHEEMISSKVSGSNRAFSFNRASDIKVNFYENFQDWSGLSNRPLVSPLADNAMFYYRYKFLGSTMENGELVNKIQVIPRRSTDPVFRGNIYILEDSWRIHSVNLYLTSEANLNFVDTLKIDQGFFPVNRGVWMPSSMKFNFIGGIFGFRFGGYFIAVYKNYDLNPVLKKADFAEVLRITKGVNKKDSSYFSQVRPIPLTDEEKIDYKKKELLAAKRESKSYLDSLDRDNNKFKPMALVIGGYNYRNRFKKEFYRFSPLATSLFYNTVEGFGINYKASYSKQIDSAGNKYFSLTGKTRYGFSSERAYGSLYADIPVKKMNVGLAAGTDVLDLNSVAGMSEFDNSIYSLLYEQNYKKLYAKKFMQISASQRIFNGLIAGVSAEWASRSSLQNTSSYSFIDFKTRQFTPNNPFNPVADSRLFDKNQSFKIGMRATYDFGKKYMTYPSGRVYQPSEYPRFGFTFSKGIKGILGSDADYAFLSVDVSKSNIKLGMYGKSSFYVEAGKFFNSKRLNYVDYKHFGSSRGLTYSSKINSFLLLDPYKSGTPDKYLEAHVEHNFSGFISNKLPLIRKLKLEEIVGVNYLLTPDHKNYTEAYCGLRYLFFKVLYGVSYANGNKADHGFRISYGF